VHAALVVVVLVVPPSVPPGGVTADGPGALHGVVFATRVLLGAPWWLLTGTLSAALPVVVTLVLHAGLLALVRRRAPATAPEGEARRPASTSSRFGLAVLAGLAVWAAWLGWDDTTSYDVVTRQDESPYVTLQVLGCALTVGVVTAVLAARWSPVVAATGVSATLRFFAAARTAVGRDEQRVEVPAGERPTVGRLLTEVRPVEGTSAADFRDVLMRCSFLVDGLTTRDREQLVPDGAVIDVMPPFAGG